MFENPTIKMYLYMAEQHHLISQSSIFHIQYSLHFLIHFLFLH